MTILADTARHYVEFESGVLFIHRKSDKRHVALQGRGLASEFRLTTDQHGADRAADTFVRAAGPDVKWHAPMFKPGREPWAQ